MKRWVLAAAFALLGCGVGGGSRGSFPGFGSDTADGSGTESSDPSAGSSGISASGADDDPSGGSSVSDTNSASDSDSDAASTSTTFGGSDSSTDGGASATEEEGDGSSSSSTGFDGATATVTGVVYNGFVGTETVAGIDVSVVGHPALATTTDGAGAFTLDVPYDEDVTLVAESAGYYGAIRSLPVPEDGLAGFDLRVFVAADLDMLAPLVLPYWDSGAGILVVEADRANVTVDGTTPDGDLVAPNTHFAWDTDGAIVESNVTAWPTLYGVTFFNLDAIDAGDVDLTATHPTLTCAIRPAQAPEVRTGFITLVDVDCG